MILYQSQWASKANYEQIDLIKDYKECCRARNQVLQGRKHHGIERWQDLCYAAYTWHREVRERGRRRGTNEATWGFHVASNWGTALTEGEGGVGIDDRIGRWVQGGVWGLRYQALPCRSKVWARWLDTPHRCYQEPSSSLPHYILTVPFTATCLCRFRYLAPIVIVAVAVEVVGGVGIRVVDTLRWLSR